jgi:LysR family transcriptional regulator of abg operon
MRVIAFGNHLRPSADRGPPQATPSTRMTLQQLRDLLAVVRYGGFRAAARALAVSQAGLTKSLARLEEEHGIDLIERTAKGVTLTPGGEEFLSYAESVLMESERAEAWLTHRLKRRTTTVSLGVSIEPSLQLAPAVLADFRRVFPDVEVHLQQGSTSELLAAVRDNRIEMAVMRIPDSMDAHDLRINLLYHSAATIVARREHPMRHATSVRELADLQWIVAGNPRQPGEEDECIRELFLEADLGRPKIAAVSDSLFGVVSMLLDSDCVARLPVAVLDHPLSHNLLAEIGVVEQQARHYQVATVHKSSRRQSKETRTLVSMLKSFSRVQGAVREAELIRS